jgi:putative transposase
MVFVDEFRGNTPNAVLKHYVENEKNALPMPPNRNEWRAVRYEHKRLKLSRKTGVKIEEFQFRGSGLQKLISLLGEAHVDVLWDPDDFRRVWVPIENADGIEQVELINSKVNQRTPAYSFTQAKQIYNQVASAENPGEAVMREHAETIRSRAAAASSAQKNAKKPKRAASAETTSAARHHAAVERAMHPVEPPPRSSLSKDTVQQEFWPRDVQAALVVRVSK